jgi:hypothetical protein
MNKYTRPDPWREIFERRGGVLGADLRCVKGNWTLSDEPVETGDAGLRICILWPIARHGERQWRDGVGNKYRDTQLYIDGAPRTNASSSTGSPSRSSKPSRRTRRTSGSS